MNPDLEVKSRSARLHCDKCDVLGAHFSGFATRAHLVRILREQVAEQGWIQRDEVDLCPKCKELAP
jgi:hypothetical protein